jgi:hypothetical protein
MLGADTPGRHAGYRCGLLAGGGQVVVIDYREARDAIAAQKLLARAGIIAVYIPDKFIAVSEDPAMTRLVVQRLEVPQVAASRATALLKEHYLWEEPILMKWD